MTDELHDMAEPRHELLDEKASSHIEEGNGTDGDRAGRTEDDATSRAREEESLSEASGSALSEYGEYHDAVPDNPADLLAVSMWSAPLPHPADFKDYPDYVQRDLMELRKMEVMRQLDRQDAITNAAIERDKEESLRQDALVAAEVKQAPVAQVGALVLNGALVLVMGAAVVTGQTDAMAPLVTALLGVNAMGLFISLRGARNKSDNTSREKEE